MAIDTVSTSDARQKLAPRTRAFLRAFELYDHATNDTNVPPEEERLAHFAWSGAESYAMVAPVETLDVAAVVALAVFDRLDNILSGHRQDSDIGEVIKLTPTVLEDFADCRDGLRLIWGYLVAQHPELGAFRRVAEWYGIDRPGKY